MRRRRAAVVVAAAAFLLATATTALAGHSVRFVQQRVDADSEVTLELRVPEAGESHNPESTQDHHTTQVQVSVPAAFGAIGCVPPDGWDCARTGELFRFFQEDDLALQRPDAFVLGLYLQTPDENGSWGFRTIQVYNDGHETRFTVEGGTAPTVQVTGAAPAASPSPSAAPSPTPAPTTAPSPSPRSSPSPTPAPTPTPAPRATSTPGAVPASPTPTPSTAPGSAAPSPSTAPTAPSPQPSPTVSPSPETQEVALGDEPPTPGGLDALERAALSLVIVSGGWTVVELRARRGRDAT